MQAPCIKCFIVLNKTSANNNVIINDANQGEFNFASPQTKKFDESQFSQKNLITKNN